MSTPKVTTATPTTVEVVLLKDHTHGGKKHKKDAKISVTAKQRKFLIDREIIAKDSPDVAKPMAADKTKG